ncbi:phosphatidylserine decarboxylase-domain-containing protein [Syncephalis fuscata]|nr:phosphatidylserine decarboxylase-domain-containing protein [Syncephalis fuscata]
MSSFAPKLKQFTNKVLNKSAKSSKTAETKQNEVLVEITESVAVDTVAVEENNPGSALGENFAEPLDLTQFELAGDGVKFDDGGDLKGIDIDFINSMYAQDNALGLVQSLILLANNKDEGGIVENGILSHDALAHKASTESGLLSSLTLQPWYERILGYLPLPISIRRKFGVYVVDRKTNEKQYEAMPMYVRIGINLLYVGYWKEKLIQTGVLDAILRHETLKQVLTPSISSFNTFNEFFYRKLNSDARPIASPLDERVVISGCDSRLIVFPKIEEATKFWIKGKHFNLANLIQDDELAKRFEGGSIAIFRLAPQDYHRFHAPIAATCTSSRIIPGKYYTVNPLAINSQIDVLTENTRTVHTFTTVTDDKYTAKLESPFDFVIVPVGAMMVGSIKLTGAQPDVHTRKGDELGYFAFGGSTVVAVFPPRANIRFDADLLDNASNGLETLVKMGEPIAIIG